MRITSLAIALRLRRSLCLVFDQPLVHPQVVARHPGGRASAARRSRDIARGTTSGTGAGQHRQPRRRLFPRVGGGMLRSKRVVMDRSRRALLLGGTLTFLAPSRLYAQPDLGREHRPMIDSPTLAEDPSAVPLQVSVNHPMEPEHFIRSIEIQLDHDPVPYKGKFLFTPANGQAAVAFHMRSGAGGVLKVTAECLSAHPESTKHGVLQMILRNAICLGHRGIVLDGKVWTTEPVRGARKASGLITPGSAELPPSASLLVNTTRRVPLRITLRGKRISGFALTADVIWNSLTCWSSRKTSICLM